MPRNERPRAGAIPARGENNQVKPLRYAPETGAGQPLVDKHGHRHSEAVFRNWSPAAIKALGIRRVGGAV